MNTPQQVRMDPDSQYAGILDRIICSYTTAISATARTADCLAGKSDECCRAVQAAEKELDRLDREIDVSVTGAIAEVPAAQARELLACTKMIVDLERVGDLLASVAGCALALGDRLSSDDLGDLVKMATIVEKMLNDAHGAFVGRNTDRAVAVLRTDAEVDRMRNLILIRQFDEAQMRGPQDALQVVFMAQALERAGDHVKNLAEEVCHLTTGRSVRHIMLAMDKPHEQMYLQYLRNRHGIPDARPVAPAAAPAVRK